MMINEFIGKEVEITVAFSTGANGTSPCLYNGTILSEDENFYKVNVSSRDYIYPTNFRINLKQNVKGIILINKKYVVSILEIQD